jgi:uncharacterized damage-inducible protein DinB
MKQNNLFLEAKSILFKQIDIINDVEFDEYTQPIRLLHNSTIGEHTRHIIELFQQLMNGYDAGIINYDDRKREVEIQQKIDVAIECMAHIISQIEKQDKLLEIITIYNNQSFKIISNYYRELLYNIEHCIHHQALIKTGLIFLGKENVDENFGVAKSTIIYKQKCAQ